MMIDILKIQTILKTFLINTIIDKNILNNTLLFGLPLEHYDEFCQLIDQMYIDNPSIFDEIADSEKIYDFFRCWYNFINMFVKICNDKYKLIEYNKEMTKELFNIYFEILYPNCLR